MQLRGYAAFVHILYKPESKVKAAGSKDGMPIAQLCLYRTVFIAGKYSICKSGLYTRSLLTGDTYYCIKQNFVSGTSRYRFLVVIMAAREGYITISLLEKQNICKEVNDRRKMVIL